MTKDSWTRISASVLPSSIGCSEPWRLYSPRLITPVSKQPMRDFILLRAVPMRFVPGKQGSKDKHKRMTTQITDHRAQIKDERSTRGDVTFEIKIPGEYL